MPSEPGRDNTDGESAAAERQTPTPAGPDKVPCPLPRRGEQETRPDTRQIILSRSPQTMDLVERAPVWESPGQPIGTHYEIIERLGSGGFGVTYRVLDTVLGREVAVKRLRAPEQAARKGIERFLLEAQAVARLNHRNIVMIHELGEDDRGLYIVMEYLAGGDLSQLIARRGALPLDEALGLIEAIGQGLTYAHRRRVFHRDIKPANIMLSADGVPKLGDFGLAKMPRESDISDTGLWMGTVEYMAPEQRRNAKHADQGSDIYALAKTLYHIITGQVPMPVDLDLVPERIRNAVKQAIKPQPEDRQFTVQEFLEDLGESSSTRSGETESARPISVQTDHCPGCGALNAPEARFCGVCGTGLFDKCPSCEHEMRSTLTFCPRCGTHVAQYNDSHKALLNARAFLDKRNYARAVKEAARGLESDYFTEDLQKLRHDAQAASDLFESRRHEAMQLVEQQEYERAADPLRKALDLASNGAAQELSRLLGELPEKIRQRDVPLLREQARQFIADEQYAKAKSAIGKALKLDPTCQDLADDLARLPELIRHRDARVLLEQANQLVRDKQFARAVDLLQQALKEDGDQPDVRQLLDQTLARAKDHEVASLLEEAKQLMGRDEYEQAETALTKARQVDPDNQEIFAALAEIPDKVRQREIRRYHKMALGLIEEGRHDLAGPFLSEALKLDPSRRDLAELLDETNAKTHNLMIARLLSEADKLVEADDLKAAEAKLREALRVDPDRKDTACRLRSLLRRIREADSTLTMGAIREALEKRDFREAQRLCREAAILDEGRHELADWASQTEKLAEEYQKHFAAASALYQAEKWPEALDAMVKLRRDYPCEKAFGDHIAHCQAWVNDLARRSGAARRRAEACEAAGALGDALKAWQELAELDGENAEAREHVARLTKHLTTSRWRGVRTTVLVTVLLAGLLVGAWFAWESRSHFHRGETLLAEREYDLALAELNLCRWWPGKADLGRRIETDRLDDALRDAESLLRQGRFGKALERFVAAAAMTAAGSPSKQQGIDQRIRELKDAWRSSIDRMVASGDIEQAVPEMAKVFGALRGDDAFLRTSLDLFDAAVRNKRWASAKEHLLAAEKAFPHEPRIRKSQRVFPLANGASIHFVLIWPGQFKMGLPASDPDHEQDEFKGKLVTISSPFYLASTEVTQEQYVAVIGTNPSGSKGSLKAPVERVDWEKAQAFCTALGWETKWSARLPDEAEWEYACRAGTSTRFYFGKDGAKLYQFGNYCDASSDHDEPSHDPTSTYDDGHQYTAPAKSFAKNPWSLYDMHGNVHEWCHAIRIDDHLGAPAGSYAVLTGDKAPIRRGGGWDSTIAQCRSASRMRKPPSERAVGFRVALDFYPGTPAAPLQP